MSKIIGALSINQGSSSLKSIGADYLSENDRCIVISDTYGVLFYRLVDNDAASENIPNIVKPSDSSTKGWYLQPVKHLTEDVQIDKDKVLNLNEIATLSDNEISIRDVSGNLLFYISDNEIKSYKQFTVSDLQVTTVNDLNTDNFILKDGSRSFTDNIAGIDPVDDEDLTTKIYVDTQTNSLSTSFDSKFNEIEDNYVRWDNTNEQTPSHDYNPATKLYVDNLLTEDITDLYDYMDSNFLSIDNTELYEPTGDYNPATKVYVDDMFNVYTEALSGSFGTYTAELSATFYKLEQNLSDTYDTMSENLSGYMEISVYDSDESGVVDEAETITSQGSLATKNNINNSNWSGTDLTIINGGTGASTTSAARNNLGVSIGSDVQSYNASLTDISGLSKTDGNFIVADGSNWVAESGTTARTSLGLGSLSTLSEVTSAEISSDTAPNEYVLTADGSGNTEWRESSGGGGSGLPLLKPDNWSLDDTDTGSSRGNAFSMVETIDFASGSDGAAWITFHFPSSLDAGTDISLNIYYNLSGSDDSKSIDLEIDYWAVADGETPAAGTPDGTNSDSISTGTSEDGKRQSASLTAIPNAAITADDTIVLKVTRLGNTDSYSGAFQILYVFPHQV